MTRHGLPGAHLRRSPTAARYTALVDEFGHPAVTGAAKRGEIIRVMPGVRVAAEFADTHDARASAILKWNPGVAAIAGHSALHIYGFIDEPTVVTAQSRPSCGLRPPPGTRLIMPSAVPVVIDVRGLRVVSIEDALIQSWERSLEHVLLRMLRTQATTVDKLRVRIALYPRIRDRRILERHLDRWSAGIESYLEARAREGPLKGIGGLKAQHPITAGGRKFRADLYHEGARLVIELDGKAFHGDDAARRRDIERDALLAGAGITTIRFTFEDIVERSAWCRATVLRAIRAHSRRS